MILSFFFFATSHGRSHYFCILGFRTSNMLYYIFKVDISHCIQCTLYYEFGVLFVFMAVSQIHHSTFITRWRRPFNQVFWTRTIFLLFCVLHSTLKQTKSPLPPVSRRSRLLWNVRLFLTRSSLRLAAGTLAPATAVITSQSLTRKRREEELASFEPSTLGMLRRNELAR